jgi:hypothetical protein
MAGSYVENFGKRMKEYAKGRTHTPRIKAGWIRMRRYYGYGGSRRYDHWIYFHWSLNHSELREFTKNQIGSYREFETIPEPPSRLKSTPFTTAIHGNARIELFTENL